VRGCLGIVTRMAIKTLPFQPEKLGMFLAKYTRRISFS